MIRLSRTTTLISLLCCSFGLGCGDTPSDGDGPPVTTSFSAPDCAPDELCLAEPAHGCQIRSAGTTISPGEDVEYCEVVALPGGPEDSYYVNAFESQMTQGSHHLIVSAIVPDSKTDANAPIAIS